MISDAKNFDILAWAILHSYFDSLIKLDLHLTKFLDISLKLFFHVLIKYNFWIYYVRAFLCAYTLIIDSTLLISYYYIL